LCVQIIKSLQLSPHYRYIAFISTVKDFGTYFYLDYLFIIIVVSLIPSFVKLLIAQQLMLYNFE